MRYTNVYFQITLTRKGVTAGWSRIDLQMRIRRDRVVGHDNSPIRSDDDGPSTFHTDTRSLRAAKKLRNFQGPETQQRHILRHWPSCGKKGPASVLKKRAHKRDECGGRVRGTMRRKENRRGERFEGSGQQTFKNAHYERVKKLARHNARAPDSTVFRSIYANVMSTNHSRLFIPRSYPTSPPVATKSLLVTFLLPLLCLFCSFLVFFCDSWCPPLVHAAEARSINARFLR